MFSLQVVKQAWSYGHPNSKVYSPLVYDKTFFELRKRKKKALNNLLGVFVALSCAVTLQDCKCLIINTYLPIAGRFTPLSDVG